MKINYSMFNQVVSGTFSLSVYLNIEMLRLNASFCSKIFKMAAVEIRNGPEFSVQLLFESFSCKILFSLYFHNTWLFIYRPKLNVVGSVLQRNDSSFYVRK